MKNLIGYGSLLATILLAAIFYVAVDVKNKFYDLHEHFGIKLVSYENGLFKAKAITEIYLQPQEEIIRIEHKITHGLMQLATIESKIMSDHQLTINTVVNFNGTGELSIHSPRLTHKFTDNNTMIIGQFTTKIKFNKSFDQLRGNILLPQFVLKEQDNLLLGSNISLEFDQKFGSNKLWFGHWGLNINTLKAFDSKEKIFGLQDLQVKLNVQDISAKLAAVISLKVKKVVIPTGLYGPGSVHLSLQSLNMDALQNIGIILRQARDQESIKPDKLFSRVEPWLQKLLQTSPWIKNSYLRLNAPEGKIVISMQGRVGGVGAGDITDLAAVRDSVAGKLFISIPKTLIYRYLANKTHIEIWNEITSYALNNDGEEKPVEYNTGVQARKIEVAKRVKIKLTNLLQDKLLIIDNNNYQIEVEYVAGHLRVNGFEKSMMALFDF